jgi:agmatine deiminase
LTPPATPYQLGYRMPAEWEHHESTWLAWPKNPLTFPAGVIQKVERAYLEIISSLAAVERVDLLVDDARTEARVARLLGDTAGVVFHHIRTADVWLRDYGPIFIVGNDGVAATKWNFNSWGNKYEDLLPDDHAGAEIALAAGLETFEPGFVLEGGSIDVNGRGSCLVTRQCLLNANRNPGRTQRDMERLLEDYIGASNVIWLDRGIAGDDTDGHVDDLARFTGVGSALCMVEPDPATANHRALARNLAVLKEARDQEGGELTVTTLRMPRKQVAGDGNPLPASYANFYIGNGVVLVPTFGNVNDEEALSTIGNLLRGRKVVGINCESLVSGFGGIHCITQQQPGRPTRQRVVHLLRSVHANVGRQRKNNTRRRG